MLFLAEILAAAALALLISRAEITAWMREALPRPIRRGVECPFCVAFWASGALVGIYGPPAGLPLPLAVLGAWGGAAAIVALADPCEGLPEDAR